MAKLSQKKASKSKPKRPIGRRVPDRAPTKTKSAAKVAAPAVPQRGEGRGSNGRAMAKSKGEPRGINPPLPPAPLTGRRKAGQEPGRA